MNSSTINHAKDECSCRKFQLTEMPCAHAVSAINHAKDEIAKYVNVCYKRERGICYLLPYFVGPCNGEQLWEINEYPDVLLLTYKKSIRRPTKKRSRAEDEPTGPNMSRAGQEQRCSECDAFGHNKRGYPWRLPFISSN
nr:uncharacterized protein LOC114925187 [Arachis hypogaea]